MKGIIKFYSAISLRKKLILLFIFAGFFPLLLLSLANYYISIDIMLNNASENLETLLRKNGDIVLQWMNHVEDEANMLSVDADLIELMNSAAPHNESEIIHSNLALKKILNKYFLGIEGVYSYHLFTDRYMMVGNIAEPTAPNSKPAMYIPYDVFHDSSLYTMAITGNGKLAWMPTYLYSSMYGLDNPNSIDNKQKYYFSAVKQINCISDLGSDRFQPILVISFLPDHLNNLLNDNSLSAYDLDYYVYSDSDFRIIYDYKHTDLTGTLPNHLVSMVNNGSFSEETTYVSSTSIVAFNRLDSLNWNQIISIPTASYTHGMSIIPKIMFLISIMLTATLCLIVFFITRDISRKFSIVKAGIQAFGNGLLDTRIPQIEDCDFSVLADSFNRMGDQMQTLITENYETKLRESETQIMALNMQMNPHFLYNTLNTINWMAIDNGQEDISYALIHLSQMLQHSFRNKKTLCSVREELTWLNDYLYIMNLRFKDRFIVRTEISDELMDTLIPRLMFQPLIENSIVHGFADIDAGGIITITGSRLSDGKRSFTISDNGSGMTDTEIENIFANPSSQIGLVNLKHRLWLIYHEEGSITIASKINSGTSITICIPDKTT